MADDDVIEDMYGVFNDPVFFEPRFASGELHPLLRTRLLDEPLYTNSLPGPAKRHMNWLNTQRLENGGPDRIAREGYVILRHQRITRTAWRTVQGQELEDVDDGRRANG